MIQVSGFHPILQRRMERCVTELDTACIQSAFQHLFIALRQHRRCQLLHLRPADQRVDVLVEIHSVASLRVCRDLWGMDTEPLFAEFLHRHLAGLDVGIIS